MLVTEFAARTLRQYLDAQEVRTNRGSVGQAARSAIP